MLLPLAHPLANLFGRAARFRRRYYEDRGGARQKLSRPVVSIGNLTVGGTGKTPMTILLAQSLVRRGLRVSVLSRGYGGRRRTDPMEVPRGGGVSLPWREAGDEPCLMAREVPEAWVTVGRVRYEAGLSCEARHEIDLHLLDDGFQHLRLDRAIDIVMVPAGSDLGHAHCLPLGPYREPPEALRAASVVVVKSADGRVPAPLSEVLASLTGASIHGARLAPSHLEDTGGGASRPVSWLQGRRVAGLAAIAEPQAFAETLERCGAQMTVFRPYPDHAVPSSASLADLSRDARALGAEAILCTQKDAVKLAPAAFELPLLALACPLEVDGIDAIVARVAALAARP